MLFTWSLRVTGTLMGPPDAGVPLSRPFADKESPLRLVLAGTEKVYGGTPPAATIWLEHAAFGTQVGSVGGVTKESGGPIDTIRVKFCDAADVPLSHTVTATGYDPGCATVPLNTPTAEIARPLGRLAEDQVYGGIPPAAVKVVL